MTREELKTQIDNDITDVVTADSISPADVGGNMKDVVDTLQPYKQITFKLSISGSTPTPTYIFNDFSDETISMSIPSTGKLRIEVTNNVLVSGSVYVATTMVNNSGVPYFLVPEYGLLPVFLDIDLKRAYDNDQSSTPSISGQFIEIRVYD